MFMLFWQCIWVQLLLCFCWECGSLALPSRLLCLNLVTDLLQNPVSVVLIGSGKLYVAERDGKVQLLQLTDRDRAAQPETVLDLTENVLSKEGDLMGLLAIAIHPRFHLNGYIFIMYSTDTDDREFHHKQQVSRFSLSSTNGTKIDKFSEVPLLEIYQSSPTAGQIWFGADDHLLYVAVGDGSKARRNRFSKASFNGKILRVDVDQTRDGQNGPYKIPNDNPFAHHPEKYLPEVFAIGFQNPWRCSEDQLKETKKGTTRLVCVDVSSKFSDFNIIQKGCTYGWLEESNSPCHDLETCRNHTRLKPDYKPPVCRYSGIAVGGAYYTPWNAYLFADYMRGSLHYLRPGHSSLGAAWLRGLVTTNSTTCGPDNRSLARQTILNVQQTSDKELYVLTVSTDQISEEPNGHLYRLTTPRHNAQAKPAQNRNSRLTAMYPPLHVFSALLTTGLIFVR